MGWLGRGMECLRPLGDPTYVMDAAGERVREVRIRCEVATEPEFELGPGCRLEDLRPHDRLPPWQIRDVNREHAQTWLDIERRRYRCRHCDRTFTEKVPVVHEDHDITRRLHEDLVLSSINRPFVDAARLHCADPRMVRRIFKAHAEEKLRRYQVQFSRILSLDEVRLLGHPRFVCCDLANKRIVDILPDRQIDTLYAFFRRHDSHYRVEVVCQDMYDPYRTAAKAFFPWALIVADRYHVVQLALDCMNTARRTALEPGRDRNLLKRHLHLFTTNRSDLPPDEIETLDGHLDANPKLRAAYGFKAKLQALYADGKSRTDAELEYDDLKMQCRLDKAMLGKFEPFFGAVDEWRDQVFNFHTARASVEGYERYTNGHIEAMNRCFHLIERARYKMDFPTLRAKTILKYGTFHPRGLLTTRFLTLESMLEQTDEPEGDWDGIDLEALARGVAAGEV